MQLNLNVLHHQKLKLTGELHWSGKTKSFFLQPGTELRDSHTETQLDELPHQGTNYVPHCFK